LVLLLAGAVSLVLGPSPAGRFLGHRLTGSAGVARAAPGAVAPGGSSADGVAAGGSQGGTGAKGQPASPAPGGPATGAPGRATPSPGAGRSGPAGPPGTVAGAIRRTGTAAVALTFDDGPDPVQTPLLLDLLEANGVKATFCLVGFRVRDNPDIVRRIAAEGHTLCNHSWQHLLDLAIRDPEYVRQDLEDTNAAIRSAVPEARIAYFRAPGGNFTPELVALAKRLGMTSIHWHVDPRDWDHKKGETDPAHVARVVEWVQRITRPGSIVLSHDNRQPDTIEAYRTLLPWLKARFALVPL
jgi:peptidoglycan-N-acetylglucosamine deacetylase